MHMVEHPCFGIFQEKDRLGLMPSFRFSDLVRVWQLGTQREAECGRSNCFMNLFNMGIGQLVSKFPLVILLSDKVIPHYCD